MAWSFLSHELNGTTPGYGDRTHFEREVAGDIACGATANSEFWRFHNHLGTHVDLPRHFFQDGKTVSDYLAEEWTFSSPQLVDLPLDGPELIGPDHLEGKIRNQVDALFLRTGFEQFRSETRYWDANPGIHPDLGPWLRERFSTLRVLGFDFISVTSWKYRDEGKAAHRGLLDPQGVGQPIRIIEDMALSGAGENLSEVWVAPLRVTGADGTVCTVFAK